MKQRKGSLTISRLNAGTGEDDCVRVMIRRDGDPASKRMLLSVTFENYAKVLLGQSEVPVTLKRDFDE